MTRIRYTQGPGQWGQLISQHNSDTGQSRYYGFDHMGNTRFLTDSAGNVTDRYGYKAFGEVVASSGSISNSLRHGGEVGYYRDKIERVYIRARHYEPPVGRWLSRDPIESSVNLFIYGFNNPINVVDPSGAIPIPTPDATHVWPCTTPCDNRARPAGKCPRTYIELAKIHRICKIDRETASGSGNSYEANGFSGFPHAYTWCCSYVSDNETLARCVRGCTVYNKTFRSLPDIYKSCIWAHEKRRRQNCIYYGRPQALLERDEVDRILDCVRRQLSACGKRASLGPCQPVITPIYPPIYS